MAAPAVCGERSRATTWVSTGLGVRRPPSWDKAGAVGAGGSGVGPPRRPRPQQWRPLPGRRRRPRAGRRRPPPLPAGRPLRVPGRRPAGRQGRPRGLSRSPPGWRGSRTRTAWSLARAAPPARGAARLAAGAVPRRVAGKTARCGPSRRPRAAAVLPPGSGRGRSPAGAVHLPHAALAGPRGAARVLVLLVAEQRAQDPHAQRDQRHNQDFPVHGLAHLRKKNPSPPTPRPGAPGGEGSPSVVPLPGVPGRGACLFFSPRRSGKRGVLLLPSPSGERG